MRENKERDNKIYSWCMTGLTNLLEFLIPFFRAIIPVCLTIVGTWMDSFTLLFERLVDTKISAWGLVWDGYAYHGKMYFLLGTIVVVVFQIVSEIKLFRKHRRLSVAHDRLKKENLELRRAVETAKILEDNVGSIIKLYLGATSKALKLGVKERISFYVIDEDGSSFSISARDSENPSLRVYKRTSFSIDEGIIGLARENGWAYVGKLPSYEKSPKDYINVCKNRFKGLTTTMIKALTMKARSYYAFRFSSHDHLEFNSLIVVESMNPEFMTEQEMNDIFVPDNEFVYTLVQNFRKFLPKNYIAEKEDL